MNTFVHSYLHICICAYMHIYPYICIYIIMSIYLGINCALECLRHVIRQQGATQLQVSHRSALFRMYMYLYIYTYVYIYIYMYLYIYIYIFIYIYIYALFRYLFLSSICFIFNSNLSCLLWPVRMKHRFYNTFRL
jgi:hypothetical protein